MVDKFDARSALSMLAEACADDWHNWVLPRLNAVEAALDERDALKAELEAARKQEPIIIRTMEGFEFLKTYEIGTKLYASPVPAQQPEAVKHEYPMQPIFLDNGLPRFEKNPIIDWLCEKYGLNDIGIWWQVNNIERKYIEQLYQLIGYSIRGYDELSHSQVSDASFDRANSMAEQLLKGGENER